MLQENKMSQIARICQKVVIHITVDKYAKNYEFKNVFTWLLGCSCLHS